MRLAKFFALSTLLFVTLACGHNHDDNSDRGGRVEKYSDDQNCDQFIKSLPAGTNYGWVESSENPSDPTSPKLKIFYYGNFAADEKSPIVFFNGGPSYDSHGSFRVLSKSQLWGKAPLVFFDQRGNGCSSHYPQGDSPEILGRLRFYGSRGIVADAEVIRKHLFGDRPWRIFGQSYGAWIVHRYVTAAPESVTAAFAHANVITENPIERWALRISSQNRVLKTYLDSYHEDAGILATLRQLLPASKCFRDGPQSWAVCGFEVLDLFASDYIPFRTSWNAMHVRLSKMLKDGALNEEGIMSLLRDEVYSEKVDPQNRKNWARRVIDRFDRNHMPAFNRHNCEQMYAVLRQRGEDPESYLVSECMTVMQLPTEWAGYEQVEAKMLQFEGQYGSDPLKVDDVAQALKTHPNLKFTLYSGQMDAAVPVELFANEVSRLGDLIRYRHFPTSGHEGYRTEPQVAADVLQ